MVLGRGATGTGGEQGEGDEAHRKSLDRTGEDAAGEDLFDGNGAVQRFAIEAGEQEEEREQEDQDFRFDAEISGSNTSD